MAHPVLEALNGLYKLEWAKTTMYNAEISNSTPPIIVARFTTPMPSLEVQLVEAVNLFNGNVRWRMVLPGATGRNYIIAPARLLDLIDRTLDKSYLDVQDEFAAREPGFGESANLDLPKLAHCISLVRYSDASQATVEGQDPV